MSQLVTLTLLILSSLLGAYAALKLRFPTIIGYIAAGLIVNVLAGSFVDHHMVMEIGDIGLTMLLFTVGLEFSTVRLARVFHLIVKSVPVQMASVFTVILVMSLLAGLRFPAAVILSIAAALSSSAILVKILDEKGDLESVPGEIAVGWEVFQDLATIPILLVLPVGLAAFTPGAAVAPFAVFVSVMKSILILTVIIFGGRYAVPKLLDFVSSWKNREFLLLSVVGVIGCTALLCLVAGISAQLGAFIAGMLIAETIQNHAVFTEIRPLRDIFTIMFFLSVGMSVDGSGIVRSLPMAMFFVLLILGVKTLVNFALLRAHHLHRKTSTYIAIYLLPMSEFGYLLISQNSANGILSGTEATFLTLIIFLSMGITTPLLPRVNRVYQFFMATIAKRLPKLFPTEAIIPHDDGLEIENHVVLLGYGRVGRYIGRALSMSGIPMVVVEYNFQLARELKKKGIEVVYGDPADVDVLDFAQVDKAKAVVIAIPDRHTQESVIANCLTLNRNIKIYCRTHHEEDQKFLKALGVHVVIQPEFEASLSIVNKLYTDFSITPDDASGKISRLKLEHGLG